MPHLWIEYSANVESSLDVGEFVRHMHQETAADGVFPLAGLRTRAVPVTNYVIADGHPDNAFVHLTLRVLPGRDPGTQKASTDRIFAAALERLKPLSDRLPMAVSMHVETIEPDLGYRLSTYRTHMAARARDRLAGEA